MDPKLKPVHIKVLFGILSVKIGMLFRTIIAKGIFFLFLIVGIPISTGAYLQNHWFMEEPMDQRSYMRTIEEIARWIVENSEEDDKIVAWHCYALEANRDTMMEISNAEVYDGKRMMQSMEEENATLFMRCYYTNHGIWRNQPLFQ